LRQAGPDYESVGRDRHAIYACNTRYYIGPVIPCSQFADAGFGTRQLWRSVSRQRHPRQ